MSSGWVKLEKSLRDDPRFLRMVRAYCAGENVTHMRITPRYAATLLLGGLAQLWMYADSHVREDDTLDLGADEINELIGIEGFAELMPVDWFEILEADRVKLPEFHTHNGTDAKKKALTAKRVARHRIRNVTQERSGGASSSNAPALTGALPDQTRPDKTICKTRARDPSDPDEGAPRETDEEREQLDICRGLYPVAQRADWPGAERLILAIERSGAATWIEIQQGIERYAALCRATGRLVLNPVRFFGDADRPWAQAWPLPEAPNPRASREAEALAKLRDRRAAIGIPEFRDASPGESADAYRAAQEAECRSRERRPASHPIAAALTAQKALRA